MSPTINEDYSYNYGKESQEKLLIGETIKSAKIIHHSSKCDGLNVLVITMESGSIFRIEGGYGYHEGNVCDEYVEYIYVQKVG